MAIPTIATPMALREWASTAGIGASALYHAGDLAEQRADEPVLEALADLVAAMAEAGILLTTQDRAAKLDAKLYAVTMLTDRKRQHSLVTGDLDPTLWRSLRALDGRPERMSASRAIARALQIPETKARPIVAELRSRDLIEDEPSSRGQPHVVLSSKGRRAL